MSTWRNTAVGAWAVAMSLIAGQSLANSDQTSSFTLGNGLEVVVIEDHRAPVVVQMLWYRAGAADETPWTIWGGAFSRTPVIQGHENACRR